jgi:serine/threonine protein kinase
MGSSGRHPRSRDEVEPMTHHPDVLKNKKGQKLEKGLGLEAHSSYSRSRTYSAIEMAKYTGMLKDILNEVRVQQSCASAHVLDIQKVFRKQNGDYVIREELMTDGKLTDHIRMEGGLGDGYDLEDTFRQMVDGVGACHDNGVVHLDLQPESVYCNLDREGDHEIKIGHFQSAMKVKGKTNMRVARGTVGYMAPELCRHWVDQSFMYDNPPLDLKAADIWSLGVVFYEVLTGNLPWTFYLQTEAGMHQFLQQLEKNGLADVFVPLPESVGTDVADLIKNMILVDPSERYTIDEVARHKFFFKDE